MSFVLMLKIQKSTQGNISFRKVIKSSLEKYNCYNYRGRVVSVGDGIANVVGLYKIQSGEMVEF